MVDPSSLGRIRVCTLLPLATASALARAVGRSPAATAFLTAFSQPVPDSWKMLDEQVANDAAGEDDLVLNERLDDMNWEAEEMTFAQELTSMPVFQAHSNSTNLVTSFVTWALFVTRLCTYVLSTSPSMALLHGHGTCTQSRTHFVH